MDEAIRDLWTAFANVPLNPNAGIFKYWLEHRNELGSPVGPERYEGEDPDRIVYQAFARGIVKWPPDGNVEVL